MDVWMGPNRYIITYPISTGRDCNVVLSHHRPTPVTSVEPEPNHVEILKREYVDYDPRIRRVIEMIPAPVSRWPLMVTNMLNSWASPGKNVVLMGDAVHSMVNHMAQGAATAMEDGEFLGLCRKLLWKGKWD
jgi:salicylate hydroxylase